MGGSLRFFAAQLFSHVWRFRGLHLASRVFDRVPAGTILQRRLYGSTVYLDVGRSRAHQLLYLSGERYVPEGRVISALVEERYRVVDVGANIGYYALLLARLTGPRGEVICVEPDRENLTELRRNIARNQLTHVRALAVAAGDVDSEIHLRPGLNASVTLDGSGQEVVAQRRLDSLVTEHVDVLKIDVEGYEGHVLWGARRILEKDRPRLFVEVHPWMLAPPCTIDEVLKLMRLTGRRLRAFRPAPESTLREKLRARYTRDGGVIEETVGALLARSRAGLANSGTWVVAA